MAGTADTNCHQPNEATNGSPCDIAVARFKELLSKEATVSPEELPEFGWKIPLVTSCDPSPYCIPSELFTFEPRENEIFKIFFKGTSKEVRIRQIFFHTPLTTEEQQWLTEFREHCSKSGWKIPLFMEPMVLRIIWLAYRKWGDNIITRSLDLAKMMVEWRQGFFPLSDQEEELKPMLEKGVMYWVGRDHSLRPLLVIRLARLQRNASPEAFKRLTIFCFEWGLRYLMVPGRVETITVLLDVRGVPLHQFPVSALTDMTNTLTKQYPFRLNRMLIINDSFFVQTVWNIAKQFLTEVQQQKMLFFRTGYEEELMKDYTPWQLEKCYGGTRPEITTFYPFPVASGPYAAGSAQNEKPYKNAYRATDRITSMGVVWEKDCRTPIQWAPEAAQVFKDLSLPIPEGLTPEPSAANGSEREAKQDSVKDEPPSAAAAAVMAEAAAATAEASAAAAEASAAAAEATAAAAEATVAAAEASVAEAQVAEAIAKESHSEPAQETDEAKGVPSPDRDGAAAAPQAAPDESADAKEAEAEVPKKLNTIDAVAVPEQPEPEAQPAEQNKVSSKKSDRAAAKVGGSKCCSRCNIQ